MWAAALAVAVVAVLGSAGWWWWVQDASEQPAAPRESWRRQLFALYSLVRMLVHVRIHALRCRYCRFSVVDDFEKQADLYPDRLQFIACDESPPREVTLGELEVLGNRVAHWCTSLELQQGDTVALLLLNCPEFVAVWMGAAKVGLSTALLNTSATGKALLHSISASTSKCKGPKTLIIDAELSKSVQDEYVAAGLRELGVRVHVWQTLLNRGGGDVSRASPTRPSKTFRANVKENDTLLYIFTSGTTGLPKASKISHTRFFLASLPLGVFCQLDSKVDRIYSPLPLFHSAAGMLGVGAALRTGAVMVIRKKFSVRSFSSDCITFKVTCIQYIGELCRYLDQAPPCDLDGNLKIANAFGNGLSKDVWQKFQLRYNVANVIEFYASTEGNLALFNATGKVGALGYVPRIFDFLYPVRLVKPDPNAMSLPLRHSQSGHCESAGVNEVGLLIGPINTSRTDRRFDGYLDKEATEKKILSNVFSTGDSYFNSSDLLTRDQVGYFFWSDRTGDTFRWKGENIATSQVEMVVTEGVPGVHECCCYGIDVPGADGKCGMASISLGRGVSVDGFDFRALFRVQQQNLQPQAILRFIRIVDGELPKTETLKYQKSGLVQLGVKRGDDQIFVISISTETYVAFSDLLFDEFKAGKLKLG